MQIPHPLVTKRLVTVHLMDSLDESVGNAVQESKVSGRGSNNVLTVGHGDKVGLNQELRRLVKTKVGSEGGTADSEPKTAKRQEGENLLCLDNWNAIFREREREDYFRLAIGLGCLLSLSVSSVTAPF